MIKTIYQLKNEYSDYKNILCKVESEERKGSLIRLKRGLYETDKNMNPLLLANHIVSPSYISFETALSYYKMIPETVYQITSASFNKQKAKTFTNQFGTFTYNDIPKSVYSDAIIINTDTDNGFIIATKEKAILDMLYKTKPINSITNMEKLLFDDFRLDEDILGSLDYNILKPIGIKYKDKNINLFLLYFKEHYYE